MQLLGGISHCILNAFSAWFAYRFSSNGCPQQIITQEESELAAPVDITDLAMLNCWNKNRAIQQIDRSCRHGERK